MICWIDINVVEVVSDYGYVRYLWIVVLKSLVIMDMLVICVEYVARFIIVVALLSVMINVISVALL